MKLLLILISVISLKCFASPFDVGIDQDVEEITDEKDIDTAQLHNSSSDALEKEKTNDNYLYSPAPSNVIINKNNVEVMTHSIDDTDEPKTFEIPLEDEDKTTNQMEKKSSEINSFKKNDFAKIEILDLRNGRKTAIKLTSGERQSFNNLNLQLEGCKSEIDNFYNKFSIASLSINGQKFAFSNDLSTSITTVVGYLISVDCSV